MSHETILILVLVFIIFSVGMLQIISLLNSIDRSLKDLAYNPKEKYEAKNE